MDSAGEAQDLQTQTLKSLQRGPGRNSSSLCVSYLHISSPCSINQMGEKSLVLPLRQDSEQKGHWVAMPSALWGHLCDWQALPAGMSKSGNQGRMAGGQVAAGLQEPWEPWKVRASPPHPSPNAVLRWHVSNHQGTLTGTILTLFNKEVTFIGHIAPSPPRD